MSSTSIRVRWNVILEEDRNGIVIRYDVSYNIEGRENTITIQQVDMSNEILLTNLNESELYSIQVRGVTSIGEGPYSTPPAMAMTEEDSK